jgi:ABC-type branched-subunit amino acid transport system substrate-binding protein
MATPSTAPTPRPTPTPSAATGLKVVFVLDSTPQGALERAMPAFQAAQLAFAAAAREGGVPTVEISTFDLEGDPARLHDLAAQVAADHSYVAAIIAPFLADQQDVQHALDVPVVSLSARDGPSPDAPTAWLRLVPRIDVQGTAVGDAVAATRLAARGVCLAPGVPDGSLFAHAVAGALGRDTVDETPTPAAIRSSGCRVIAWTGDATTAAETLLELGRPRPRVIGGPALREPAFLELAGTTAGGVAAICGCADVSTSLALAAQRFIQDFQSEYGRAPGPGAVEGWDGAHLLLNAIRQGGGTAAGVNASLERVTSFEGLGGRYRFAPDGDLANPTRHLERYRVVGGRWVPATVRP